MLNGLTLSFLNLFVLAQKLETLNELQMRDCLVKRIEKAGLYSTKTGNIFTFNLDSDSNESICCYYLYSQTNKNENDQVSNEYLTCFILNDSQLNLDLFRNELDKYFNDFIINHLNIVTFHFVKLFLFLFCPFL
jgi:hypothetical protein